jgi:L-aminopeptidase/D-esterase-like protein
MGIVNTTLTRVEGLLVGNYQRRSGSWLTGTTVVIAPTGAVAGVDVRGGGPGTRETDALRPENLVPAIHAVCLTGGSAYGLSAADGVMTWCAEAGLGFPVGPGAHEVVPVVPTAVIFDLGRAGRFDHRPDAEFGYRAARAASSAPVRSGTLGAGTGARAGGLKGGLGSAGVELPDGTVVAALVVLNAAGSAVDGRSGLPYQPVPGLRRPDAADRRRLRDALTSVPRTFNTTIGVVATSAALDKASSTKLAQVAHDGLARAVRPSHLLVDGDTVFALATGSGPTGPSPHRERTTWINALLTAGADCFAMACADAVVSARGTSTMASYRDLCPSAFV